MKMKFFSKKRLPEYAVLFGCTVMIAVIYMLVIREGVELARLNRLKDAESIRANLRSLGAGGCAVIALLEMLQMIVVFVPAEFVQISAGLAYPIWIALPVCMLGVSLGASAIFVIVRCLHLRLSYFERKEGKIRKLLERINREAPMTAIMYILFVMPLVPFGAIAYFASSSRISYGRYVLTCATGVIPSVLSSYILGNTLYRCVGMGRRYTLTAVLVVGLLMLVLLCVTASILKRRLFKDSVSKPSFLLYHLLYQLFNLYFTLRLGVKKGDCAKLAKGPVLVLGRHTSFYDFFHMAKAVYPRRLNIVTNRYYFKNPFLAFLLKRLGAIPKSLFTSDIETVRKMLSASASGCSVAVFPEGRLSTDGTGFSPVGSTASLVRKLGRPVYMYTSVGGYFAAPKWRSGLMKNGVEVRLSPLIGADEVASLDKAAIEARIAEAFVYDECREYAARSGSKRDRDVSGLEKILYRCPACKNEYCLTSSKEALSCSSCGASFEFDLDYLCDGKTVSQLSHMQLEALTEEADGTLSEKCLVWVASVRKRSAVPNGEGVCTLADGVLRYEGTLDGESLTLTRTVHEMPALAFSCGEEFEFYHNNRLLYFYPENRASVAKWSALWDIFAARRAAK